MKSFLYFPNLDIRRYPSRIVLGVVGSFLPRLREHPSLRRRSQKIRSRFGRRKFHSNVAGVRLLGWRWEAIAGTESGTFYLMTLLSQSKSAVSNTIGHLVVCGFYKIFEVKNNSLSKESWDHFVLNLKLSNMMLCCCLTNNWRHNY